MAFRIKVPLENYEYRALRSGKGKSGPWMSIVLESPEDAQQVDVSIPQDMQADVYGLGLSKGDKVTLTVVAYAGPEYSRVSLVSFDSIVDVNGEVQL